MNTKTAICVFLLTWLPCTVASACPEYKDPEFYLQKKEALETGDYERLWNEINTSNGKCLMQKFAEKGALILTGKVKIDKCEGVRYLRKALLRNIDVNQGEIAFESSENWAKDLLNIYYNDAYFEISAVEGDEYARYKVGIQMIQKINDGYGSLLGDELDSYIKTALIYLKSAEKIPGLRGSVLELSDKIIGKMRNLDSVSHVDTSPRRVVCWPDRH